MKIVYLKHLVLALALTGITGLAQAQLALPAPSPAASLTQAVGLGEVKVNYSRPGKKGRQIFGKVVPFGALWRTGANAATKFTFSEEVTIAGTKVPKGEYSLFSIPNAGEWTIILNKNANANTGNYKPEEDVVRFQAKTSALPMEVESFTINFANLSVSAALVEISWDKTMVSFPIVAEVDSKVNAQIARQLDPKRDAGLYYQIATYYYDNNRNLDEAYDLVTKSVDWNPQFWVVHLKAKLEAKLKKYNDAIGTAQKSMDMAKAQNNMDYVRLNEELIAECKKMGK
ncbi:MAG: DUF2911 domain-containing protein [Bernardetiaceae bacterium]|jgi:hypothetical protein|nr:DUF2911 domain-containing protein [Bernardetiaceae bacterium]